MAYPEVRVKAFVLLSEEEYLKENVKNPECYFVSLKKRNILTEEQCQELRGISDFKARTVKLVELVSSHPNGFDVFCTLTRKNREDNHVSSFLKRKLSENSFLMAERSPNDSGLSMDQQQHLKLLQFLEHASTTHEIARGILEGKNWDVTSSLEAAREMGLGKEMNTIICNEYGSPRSSSGCSIGDSGEFEEYSSLGSSGSTGNSSARSSSSDLPLNNNGGGVCGGYESEVGPRPIAPYNVTPSPISPVTNDVHPEHGVMPQPPEPSWRDTEYFPNTDGHKAGGDSSTHSTGPSTATAAVSSSPACATDSGVPVPALTGGGRVDRPTTLLTGKKPGDHVVTGTKSVGDRRERSKPNVDQPGKADFCRSSSAHQLEVGQSEGTRSSPSDRTNHSPRKHDEVSTDGTNQRKPVVSPMAHVGSYWVCYHCHQKNSKEEVVCQVCQMLSYHTQPSWDLDDDVSKNYLCRECSLAVRLPCEPCPPPLINCLQKMVLCNKCYRAICCRSTPHNTRPPLSMSLLESKPTLVKLRSMQEKNGASIHIIDEVAPRWDDLAPQLDIPNNFIRILLRDCPGQCQTASLRMFSKWVDKHDVTWKLLLDALRSINEDVLAIRVEQACHYFLSSEQKL